MSVSFFLVLAFVSSLFFGQTLADTGSCYTLKSSDLSFCTHLVGQSVDSFYTETKWAGKPYYAFIDGLLNQTYMDFVYDVKAAGTQDGFSPCTDCETQFQWMLCAAAFPKCGFVGCLTNLLGQVVDNLCPQGCYCKNCKPFISTDCAADGGENNPEYNITAVGECNFTSLADQVLMGLSTCESFEVNVNHCNTFVNTCTCGSSKYSNICPKLFSDSGFTLSNWPNGSCTGVQGWCNNLRRDDNDNDNDNDNGNDNDEDAGDTFCLYSDLCITIPKRLVALATSISHQGISPCTNMTSTSLKFVSSTSKDTSDTNPDSSSGTVLIATPVLLLLSLFLTIFFA